MRLGEKDSEMSVPHLFFQNLLRVGMGGVGEGDQEFHSLLSIHTEGNARHGEKGAPLWQALLLDFFFLVDEYKEPQRNEVTCVSYLSYMQPYGLQWS